MYDFLTKRGQMLAFIVGIVVVIIFFVTANSGMSAAGYDAGTDLAVAGKEKLADGSLRITTMNFFNVGIWLTVILLALAAGLSVLFGFFHVIKFPKQSLKSLIGVAVLVVLFFVFYSMA